MGIFETEKPYDARAINSLVEEAGIAIEERNSVAKKIRLLLGSSDGALDIVQQGLIDTWELRRFRGAKMVVPDFVGQHQERVRQMIIRSQHLLSVSFPGFDFTKANFMASYHDASEWISPLGDIPTPVKAHLSPQSKKLLDLIERRCIELLSRLHYIEYYGEFDKVVSIYTESHEKSTLESWVMKWFDLVDPLMAVMRDLEHGNNKPQIDAHGNDEGFSSIYGRYLQIMKEIREWTKYPEIGKILRSLKYDEWRELMKEDFGGMDLYDHYMASEHFFDIDALATDIRLPDGSYRFPECYDVWSEMQRKKFPAQFSNMLS